MIIFEHSIAQNEEDLMHELTLTISSRVAELTAHVIDEMSIRRDAGCMVFQDSICTGGYRSIRFATVLNM